MRIARLLSLTLVAALVACSVDVTTGPIPPVHRVDVSSPTPLLAVGVTVQLTAVARALDGTPISARAIVWSTSDAQTATVTTTGKVTAVGTGPVVIRATSGGKFGEVALLVQAAPAQVARVAITSAGGFAMDPDATLQLAAAAYAADNSELTGRPVTWSNAPSISAQVSATGLVTALVPGTIVVRATIDGSFTEVTITVRHPVAVAQVVVAPTALTLPRNGTHQLFARILAADGSELSGRALTWSSEDPTIVLVSASGQLQALRGGVTWITATSEGQVARVQVTVPSWEEAPLRTVGGTTLPFVVTSYPFIDGNGVEVTRTIKLTAGRLRVNLDTQEYEQRMTLERWESAYFIFDGEPVFWGVQMVESRELVDQGTAGPIHAGVQTLAFSSTVTPGQLFMGFRTATGFDITQRINGSGPELLLKFVR